MRRTETSSGSCGLTTPQRTNLSSCTVDLHGVSSSPLLLNATIAHHLGKYSSVLAETVEKISRSIYVDDVAYGAEAEDLAYKLYTDFKSMLKEGGKKIVTNSSALQKRIDENESLLQLSTVQPSL